MVDEDPLQILVYCAAGGNIGDDAIFLAVRDRLRRLRPNVRITVACPQPHLVSAGVAERIVPTFNQVDSFYWGRSWLRSATRRASETLAAFRASDLVIVGGGGLLNDMFGLRWLSQWLAAPVVARWLGRPVVVHGVGAGPLTSHTARRLVRWALKAVLKVTVRDEYSAEALQKAGVAPHLVEVTADPVAGFCLPDGTAGQGSGDWIGIIPRLDQPASASQACLSSLIDPYHDLVRRLVGRDLRVCVLAMSRVEARLLQNSALVKMGEIVAPRDPLDFMRIAGQARAIVSTRMHGCLLAALAGAPVLSVTTYDPKLHSIALRLGITCVPGGGERGFPSEAIVAAVSCIMRGEHSTQQTDTALRYLRNEADREDQILRAAMSC